MFIETPIFPKRIALRSTGGPGWDATSVVEMSSGYEQRNQPWSQSRRYYEVSHVPKTPDDFDPLLDFWEVVQGDTHGFRLFDPRDYRVSTGFGLFRKIDATHWQMVRRRTVGAQSIDRDIRKPVDGTITITGSYSDIDYTTGIVTGTPTAWIGEFHVPCRFATKRMQGDIVDATAGGTKPLIAWNNIPIVEIRV